MNVDAPTGAAGIVAAGVTGTGVTGATAAGTGVVGSDAALRQILHGLPGVDQVGAHERAASLATRSIKRGASRLPFADAISAAIPATIGAEKLVPTL